MKIENNDVAVETLLTFIDGGGGISLTEIVVLKVKLKRQQYSNLHIIELFTRCTDIASSPSTEQSHLGKCSNGKLHISTLVNDGSLRSTVDFASAPSNVKMLIMFKMLKYLICLCFL